MKIVLCASVSFARETLAVKDELLSMGYSCLYSENLELFASGQKVRVDDDEIKTKRTAIIKYYEMIKASDAILALNFDKNGIKNYIGANTFLEMGYAYALGKKIFLLNPIPDQPYLENEVKTFNPVILNGNLKTIKQ